MRTEMPRGRLLGLASLGIVLGAVGAAVALANTAAHWRVASSLAAFILVVGPVAAGVLALRLRAPDRFGYLLIFMGGAAFLASLADSGDAFLYSVGRVAGWLIAPALAYIMLAYPSGRLARRSERLIVGAFVFVVVVGFVPNAFLLRQYPTPYPWTTCVHACPANAFMVVARQPAYLNSTLRPVLEVTATLLFLSAVVAMWGKIRRASPLLRRTLVPVMAAGILYFAAYSAYLIARRAGTDPAALQLLAWLVLLSLPVFAASFVVGLLWARVYSAQALERLALGLNTVTDPGQLRDLIAEALSDPSVELYYPQPGGAWWDGAGRRVALPLQDAGRCVSQIPADGDPVAVIAYDAALRDQRRLVRAVGASASTTLARLRMTVALSSSVRKVEAAQGRMAAVAAEERHRIGRDLHDGAQQRLVTLRINLELAAEQIEQDPDGGTEQLRALGEEVDATLEEIRSLATGIFPPLLSDAGLGEALHAIALRGPIATAVKTEGLRRYPLEIESAAYFCCLEALQNSAKHARNASEVTIRLADDGQLLRFDVADDGAGFVIHRAVHGSGLTNMRDRLGVVGGRVWIDSAPGRGTVVHGQIPITGEFGLVT
ncbi:MAG TPA: histidine kinase [Streptosporangiaceae bacterium]